MAMTLRLPENVENKFREASAEAGLSMNSAAEAAITEWIMHREQAHIQDVTADIVQRHARLLARLAE